MSYCTKCGKKNEDDAKFCNACGYSMSGEQGPCTTMGPSPHREFDRECNEECSGRRHSSFWAWFIVTVIALIIIGIMFTLTLKIFDISGHSLSIPESVRNFPFWEICPLFVLLILFACILSIVIRSARRS